MLQSDRENGSMTPHITGGRDDRGGGRGRGNNGNASNKRKIQQLEQVIDDLTSQGVPEQVDTQRSAISQVTTTGSVMDGRASQVKQRTGGREGGRDWS